MERVIATFWREMKEKNNHGGGDRSFIGVKTACTFKKGFRKRGRIYGKIMRIVFRENKTAAS